MSAAAATGLVWAAFVAALLARHAPPPARVRRVVAGAARHRPGAAPASRPRLDLAFHAGRLLVPGRRVPRDDVRPVRRRGCAVLAAAVVAPFAPALAPVVGSVVWCAPLIGERRRRRARADAFAADLPEAVDLLLLAVDAGLTVPLALEAVARRGAGPLAGELSRVVDEVRLGRRLADALDDLPARAGEPTRPLVAALVASERYGVPLARSLARLGDDARHLRRRRAEERARRLPVALLFPLVFCSLPAFGLLTVAPLVAGAARSLRP